MGRRDAHTWMVGIPDGGDDITDNEEVAKVGRGSDDEEVAKVGNEMTTTNEDVILEIPATSGKKYFKTPRFFDSLCSEK